MTTGGSILRRSAPPLLILLLAIAGAGLLIASKPKSTAPSVEEKVWLVDTQAAEIGRHVPSIPLLGRVESAQTSQLSTPLNSEIKAVLVAEGDVVKKDQPLIRLDERDALFRLQQRKAELAEIEALISSEAHQQQSNLAVLEHEKQLLTLARQELQRTEQLNRDKLTAQSQIDEARQAALRQEITLAQRQLAVQDYAARTARLQAQKAKAEALLAAANLDMENTLIRAPFDARITQLLTSPGNRARPNDTLLELYAIHNLEVRAQIPSVYLDRIQTALAQGNVLKARTSGDTEEIELSLRQLSGQIKTGRGGRDALLTFASDARDLTIGQILELRLDLPPADDTLVIPRQALYGNDRVYTVHDDRLMAHQIINLGEIQSARGDSLLLVRSATISPGDQIVITQLPSVIAGMKVRAHE